jgi:hypothetical protein
MVISSDKSAYQALLDDKYTQNIDDMMLNLLYEMKYENQRLARRIALCYRTRSDV